MVQFAGMPLAFDVFPYQYSFLNGGGFPTWINNVIGVPHAEMARLLMQVYNPAGVEQGTAGVINTLFIADAWANFGWVGIILAPIYLGVLIQVIYHRLITIPKSPVNVALNGYFMTSFQITGGLIGFIWNPIWIFLAFILLLGLGFSSPVPQTNSGGNVHPNELNFER